MPIEYHNTSTRQLIREKARLKKRRSLFLLLAIVLAVSLLVGVTALLIANARPARVSRDYKPQDVVYNQPLFATHEMTIFDPDSIPFLPSDGPQPEIAFSEDFYDFGVIGLKDIVTQEFVIANKGDAPLTITNAYTTCGCTTVDITASVIPPGKVALATLVFDAGFHYSGGQTVRRGLIIVSNDPNHPRTEIWTQATVNTVQ